MSRLTRKSLKAWRAIAGKNSALEKIARHQVGKVTSRLERNYSGKDYVIFWEKDRAASRSGIYLNGGCDMPAIFTTVPAIRRQLNGTVCIRRHGAIADSHTSLLLQSLNPIPPEHVSPVVETLKLSPDYFKPCLFEPTITVAGPNGPETFDKNVVVFSIGPDIIRTLYQHKEHGFLVDPGGYWLTRSMEEVLADMSATLWFQQTFRRLEKIDVDAFSRNLERIVDTIHQRMDAVVLILNVLTVEPGNRTYNYQYLTAPYELRRREFCCALADLSRTLDFYIVDVDGALKTAGLRETQMDFAHYPDEVFPFIGREFYRILEDLGTFS